MSEDNSDDDREVASVLGSGLKDSETSNETPSRNKGRLSRSLLSTPARSSTVLTNVSRGNTSTVTPCHVEEQTRHSSASEGEIMHLKLAITENNVDDLDSLGLTCLMWAACSNQLEIVHFLLDQNASLDLRGADSGATALIYAASQGHSGVVKTLLEKGANPDLQCKTGNTALLYATHENFVACVNLLLDWGANLAQQNGEGMSAFQVAIKRGHRKVQTLIEDHILTQFNRS